MVEKIEDFNLPNAVVVRLVKEQLPNQNIALSKECRIAIGKAATVFVLFITGGANAKAKEADRKTLSSQDVLKTLQDLDFGEFIPTLEKTLEEYRQKRKAKLDSKKQSKDEQQENEEEEEEDDDVAEENE